MRSLAGLLEASWGLLEASWVPLGASWALLGASWGHLGVSWLLNANEQRVGSDLEPSWGRLGVVLGLSCGCLGLSGTVLASKMEPKSKNLIVHEPERRPVAVNLPISRKS